MGLPSTQIMIFGKNDTIRVNGALLLDGNTYVEVGKIEASNSTATILAALPAIQARALKLIYILPTR